MPSRIDALVGAVTPGPGTGPAHSHEAPTTEAPLVTPWRLATLLAAALLAAGSPDAAATGEDPDWPCVQRLVPEIAPAVVWAGPPIESVDGAAANPLVEELATELAARRVSIEEATAQVEQFAGTLADEQKNEQLTGLFARTLEIINNDRSSIIQGIKKYARGQRALGHPDLRRPPEVAHLPLRATGAARAACVRPRPGVR